jgi:signal transduction histidine kinase
MVPIKGYLDMLVRMFQGQNGSERALRYASRAAAEMQRLERLVSDLMDLSRLQTGKFSVTRTPVRLDTLLEQTVETAQLLTSSQQIVLTLAERSLFVNGDSGRLQQAITNLINNAVIHADSSPRVDVRLRREGTQARIEVQDYGPGIQPEEQQGLFKRFYQANRGFDDARGLGLGLFICHQIVSAHDGSITVDSTPGQGTTFTILLPLLEE